MRPLCHVTAHSPPPPFSVLSLLSLSLSCLITAHSPQSFFTLSLSLSLSSLSLSARMSYSDFTHQFSRLEICSLTPDALTSDEVGRWNHYQFDGTWRVRSPAGACRHHTRVCVCVWVC